MFIHRVHTNIYRKRRSHVGKQKDKGMKSSKQGTASSAAAAQKRVRRNSQMRCNMMAVQLGPIATD